MRALLKGGVDWTDPREPSLFDQTDLLNDRTAEPVAALYREQAPRLLRFFARRVTREEADDLVQDTFVRLVGAAPASQRAIASPGAFLTRIATNLLADRAKLRSRRAADLHQTYEDAKFSAGDPHRLFEGRDALARLDALVAQLPRRRRDIFLLHEVEGLTYDQIAAEAGMSVKGVKKQMAKALIELRRAMGPL